MTRIRTGSLSLLALCLAASQGTHLRAAPYELPSNEKQRIVVMTDIGGDPDDRQSLVRFLLYTCDFQVEGLCTGFGYGHYQQTRPDLIRAGVEAYGKVLPNLRRHRSDYPSCEALLDLIKDGHNGDPHTVGPGMDSEASEWIARVLQRDDPRPIWFSIWGGPRELAQALWKLSRTLSPDKLAAVKRKIRVHSIADQDRTAGWIKKNHPDIFWIYSNQLFRGIWKEGDQALVSPEWLAHHVLNNHGPLGALYPPKAAGKDGVKEGDSPSFLYLLPNGLSDPEHPEWGGWGGRFQPSGYGHEFIPVPDFHGDEPDLLYAIHRWRRAYQNAFQARMDWCIEPFDEANHDPRAVCNGDRSLRVLPIQTKPGENVHFSAAGSEDPDGDPLTYRWWVYREAGTYWDAAAIRGSDRPEAVVTVPENASGRTIHVILEVTDRGRPPLTSYRRVVLKVSGQPVPPPPGTATVAPDWKTPVTRLEGPRNGGPWEFWRGININGEAVEIDDHRWEGEPAKDFVCQDRPLVNTEVKLRPPTDAARASMIRSFRWNRQTKLELHKVPRGTYAVYAYVWEETSPETFRIRLNGHIVERDFYSGLAGQWRRLGPWITDVTAEGKLTIDSSGGAANFSGLEIWRRAERSR